MSNLLFIFMSFVLSYADNATNSFVNGDKTYVANEVDKLRDGVLNSKLQLQMFQEILKSEGINRYYPKLVIGFRNDLTERYRIFSVEYIIDGVKTFFYQVDLDEKASRKTASANEVKDFSTTISPGKHTVQVVVSFVGNDSGIFSYLSEYKVQVAEDKNYDFEKNNDYKLSVRTYEHGGLLTDFKDKAKLEVALTKMVR